LRPSISSIWRPPPERMHSGAPGRCCPTTRRKNRADGEDIGDTHHFVEEVGRRDAFGRFVARVTNTSAALCRIAGAPFAARRRGTLSGPTSGCSNRHRRAASDDGINLLLLAAANSRERLRSAILPVPARSGGVDKPNGYRPFSLGCRSQWSSGSAQLVGLPTFAAEVLNTTRLHRKQPSPER
jgi:hypothetical protein